LEVVTKLRRELGRKRSIRSLVAFCAFFPPLVAAQTPAAPSTPLSLEQQALKAYGDKHYAESAHLFDAAFAAGLSRSDDAYMAASSYALTGDAPRAVAYLERAVQLGFRHPDYMQADSGLASLRADKQFPLLVERADANKRAYDAAHHDPGRATIVTSDIDLFWRAYGKMKTSPHPEQVLEDDYLLRGSPGLQDFLYSRIKSASALLTTIQHDSKYYAAIQPATLHIKDFDSQIHASFRKMQQLYPEATFPDVYFVIGRLSTAGTPGPSGLLLGAEMFGRGPDVPTDELNDWLRESIETVDGIPYVVAHELIHYQQNTTPSDTLLAAAIHEGSADFIGELISGGLMNQAQYKYGIAHEAELWRQFSAEMNAADTSHWLYEGKVVDGRPADMAYFVGYRITQAYYERAADKKKALHEILNFKDVNNFLHDSGYADKAKSSPAPAIQKQD